MTEITAIAIEHFKAVLAEEGSRLSGKARKYPSGSHDKSWPNSLNARERVFNASFLSQPGRKVRR